MQRRIVCTFVSEKKTESGSLLRYLINELYPVLPSLLRQLHRKGYNSRIKISVFRVSNSSRSLVILSWDREARISLSWCARALVLLRRGMNLAAQDTLFPLCTTRFTKLKQPLGRNRRTSPDQTWAENFPHPGLLTAACCSVLQFSSTRSSFCCVWGAVALSWLFPKRSNVFPSREKLLQVMQARAGKGWCSWIPGTDLMWQDWDAPIAKKPCPGTNLWASGWFFFWLELLGLSHPLSEIPGKHSQHTWECPPTSAFTSTFSDFSGPTSASAAQMGNEIFPGSDAVES